MTKAPWIRNLYLYLVCAITLFMIVFAVVSLVNLGLRTWVFTRADHMNYAQPAYPAPCTIDKNGTQVCPSPLDQEKIVAAEKQQADDNRAAQRQSDLVNNLSMLIVAIPLFAYHWRVIRRDRKEVDA